MSKVIRIEKRRPDTALENLNRLTGLDFESWPESLLATGDDVTSDMLAPSEHEGEMAPQRIAEHGR